MAAASAASSPADRSRRLVCKDCQKAFTKPEHLRRHERSHTGSKPFVCKECGRPFARQDALARHGKLHSRQDSAKYASPSSVSSIEQRAPTEIPTAAPSSTSTWDCASQMQQSAGTAGQSWVESQSNGANSRHVGLQSTPLATDLDLALIWPDSEELFHSIMSSEAVEQCQVPLGTLPFPPIVDQTSITNFGSSSTFGDQNSVGSIPSGKGHQAVRDVSEMVTSLSSSVTAAVKSSSITSVFLDECLHMFFVRFVPTFPILHRPTFVFRECTHPLLLNAIAIGSLYLGPKDAIAKGEALWRLAHTAVATSWQTLITHRGPYDACQGVQLVITALLGHVYGALSKNRAIRTTSQIFRGLGFFWARNCGMFETEPAPVDHLPSLNAPAAEKEHHWRTWVSREIQRRALLAYYIVDGLLAQLSGEATSVRHVANQLTLPSSDAAFEASTADEWLASMRTQSPDNRSFRYIFRQIFPTGGTPDSLEPVTSAFSLRVILEGLQSLLSDCDDDDDDSGVATVGVPGRPEVRRALFQVFENINTSLSLAKTERLEILLRWHTICLDAVTSSSMLFRHVCSSYNVEQHVCSGGGKGMRRGFDLGKWAHSGDGRRALLHAVAIQQIVEELPRGRAHVIHMPGSLFAAAIVYIVFSLAGNISIPLPRAIDWEDVLLTKEQPPLPSMMSETVMLNESPTSRFIRGELRAPGDTGSRMNVLYELNTIQKLFRCLSSQWGISHDMEAVVDRCIALCH
ncbi:hypothetical protein VTN96DRAFT_9100 [Rasamsonia emersonii]